MATWTWRTRMTTTRWPRRARPDSRPWPGRRSTTWPSPRTPPRRSRCLSLNWGRVYFPGCARKNRPVPIFGTIAGMNAVPQPVKRAVPLLDLKPQYQAIKTDIDAAIARVCASQMFILGPEVEALEKAIAHYSGAKFGIGMSSGTDALLIALMAYDIATGDEVITASFTFFATGGTVARTGARPVFVDIDPKTYNISPAAVER